MKAGTISKLDKTSAAQDTQDRHLRQVVGEHLLPEAKVVLFAMVLTGRTKMSTLDLGEACNAPMSEIGEAWISLKTAGINISKSTDWVELAKAGE